MLVIFHSCAQSRVVAVRDGVVASSSALTASLCGVQREKAISLNCQPSKLTLGLLLLDEDQGKKYFTNHLDSITPASALYYSVVFTN